MQRRHKRGNGKKKPRKRNRYRSIPTKPLEVACLTLHAIDPITGNGETVYSLFYEYYRGYTIYSTEQERCSIHGKEGCLRIEGKYACFPNVEQAKNMIKHFRTDCLTSEENMNRYVPKDAYLCLNGTRQRNEHHSRYRSVSA